MKPFLYCFEDDSRIEAGKPINENPTLAARIEKIVWYSFPLLGDNRYVRDVVWDARNHVYMLYFMLNTEEDAEEDLDEFDDAMELEYGDGANDSWKEGDIFISKSPLVEVDLELLRIDEHASDASRLRFTHVLDQNNSR